MDEVKEVGDPPAVSGDVGSPIDENPPEPGSGSEIRASVYN